MSALCTCPYTDPKYWLSAASCGYGSGYEPGSMQEWDPDCPEHRDNDLEHIAMTTPLTYLAVVADLGIDPGDYTETSHRVQPDDHSVWQQEAEARCFEGPLPKRTARKTARKGSAA